MAGFGVKLWPIVQNVGQLKQHYSKSWETFVANSGIVTAFGVSDSETLKVLSECLGRTGIVVKVDSGASRNALSQGASPFHDDRNSCSASRGTSRRMAFGRSKNRALIYNVEKEPAVVERFCYFKDKMFKGSLRTGPELWAGLVISEPRKAGDLLRSKAGNRLSYQGLVTSCIVRQKPVQ